MWRLLSRNGIFFCADEGKMQKIPLSQTEVGMVLAGDVTATDGKVLGRAGSAVDDAMLRRFALAGVKKLVVQGKPVPGAGMGYDAAARAERIKHLFRAHQNDSFMMALKTTLYKHFKERS
jgi:hypothetical protein